MVKVTTNFKSFYELIITILIHIMELKRVSKVLSYDLVLIEKKTYFFDCS